MEKFVILARHHTCDDLIALSETDNHWHAIPEEQWPADGEAPLHLRDSMSVKGTYFQRDTVRFCAYWSEAGDFCFRNSADQVFRLFHRDSNGNTSAYGDISATISPAINTTGPTPQRLLAFDLILNGQKISHFKYDGELFRQLFQSDTTAFTDRTLGSWDFFVGVSEAVDALKRHAAQVQRTHTNISTLPSISTDKPPTTLNPTEMRIFKPKS
jgi:hypothetical protein